MNLLLVQAGESTWEQEGRIEAPSGAPLTEDGFKHATRIAEQLRGRGARTIYASDADAEQQTAKVVAHQLKLRMHTDPLLNDLDFGLWQGLLIEDIRQRQPKLFKQWLESPADTCPPGGEPLQDAQARLLGSLRLLMRHTRRLPMVVVLRPLAMGLVRCHLDDAPLDNLWSVVDRAFTFAAYDAKPQHF